MEVGDRSNPPKAQRAVVLTFDDDFQVYRRHGRQVVPTLVPPGA